MNAVFNLVDRVIWLYIWLVIISVVLSWLVSFNVINTHNRFVYIVMDFLHRITEPALRPIRGLLRRLLGDLGGIDVSPVVLILLLYFASDLLRGILA